MAIDLVEAEKQLVKDIEKAEKASDMINKRLLAGETLRDLTKELDDLENLTQSLKVRINILQRAAISQGQPDPKVHTKWPENGLYS